MCVAGCPPTPAIGGGGRASSTPGGVRYLQQVVFRSRRATVEQLRAQFNLGMPRHVGQRTVRRYLHRMALLNYAAVTKLYLTPSHVSCRLALGHGPSAWSLAEWGAGGFSDKNSFTVRPAREGRVWGRPNEPYLPVFLRPWFNSGRSTLSVWAAFSSRGRTPLVRIDDRLIQVKNMDIIHEYLLPLVERRHGGALNFILMEDNSGPHRAINVGMYVALHGLLRLDWARSHRT